MTRKSALRHLAAAYDRHAEAEQEFVGAGAYDRAAEAHERAMVCLRAYRAEMDDPEPRPTCGCVQCGLYRVGVRRVS